MGSKGLILSALGYAGGVFEKGVSQSCICNLFMGLGALSESRMIRAFFSCANGFVSFFERLYERAGADSAACRILRLGDRGFLSAPLRSIGDIAGFMLIGVLAGGFAFGFSKSAVWGAVLLFAVFAVTRADIGTYFRNSLTGKACMYVYSLFIWSDIDEK